MASGQLEERTPQWRTTPRWYLWDGGFMLIGASEGIVPPHAHHAIQLVVGLTAICGIAEDGGEWQSGRGMVVMPDVVHRYQTDGGLVAMLFVDPESTEGIWLRTTLTDDITLVPDARVEAAAIELQRFLDRPLEAMEIGTLIRHCVASLCAGAPPSRKLDERVTRLLKEIAESDDLRITAEDAAARIFLSPGRFQHLFKQQVGLPFRRYMLWRKLTRAMLAIGRERTLTAAAQTSDFSDAAHLTRTFYQMFGLPPSVLMRGEFFVLESPFGTGGM
jgi:AraC family transcriptional regulator